MFWLVHGIFVFALPAFAGFGGDGSFGGSAPCFDATGFPIECPSGAFGEVIWSSVLIGAIALFISHGASFFLNYLGRGEYLTATPGGQMGRVYGLAELIVAKQRHGSTGKVRMKFDSRITKFSDLVEDAYLPEARG